MVDDGSVDVIGGLVPVVTGGSYVSVVTVVIGGSRDVVVVVGTAVVFAVNNHH